jgi:hypothetical protein
MFEGLKTDKIGPSRLSIALGAPPRSEGFKLAGFEKISTNLKALKR